MFVCCPAIAGHPIKHRARVREQEMENECTMLHVHLNGHVLATNNFFISSQYNFIVRLDEIQLKINKKKPTKME